jgi:glycosyltransferase involved in cell wall biosynthesis
MALISVIIPAFNSGPHLRETLESVLAQTHRETEVIVVDDGSTDGTPDVIRSFAGRIRAVRQKNRGIGAARNRGFQLSAGAYVAFLDHDDTWLPQALACQLVVAQRHPESGLVACDGVQFAGDEVLSPHLLWGPVAERLAESSNGEVTGRFYDNLIRGNLVLATTGQVLLPRHVFERFGPFSERWVAEDWDLWLRIAERYPITLHAERLIRYRFVPTSMSGPEHLRDIRWALRRIPVIRRHLHACAPSAAPLFRARLRETVREASREAYYLGRRSDRSVGRSYLARLVLFAPEHPVALLHLIMLCLPQRVVSSLSSAARTVRAWLSAA